jgi:hypothetical protein
MVANVFIGNSMVHVQRAKSKLSNKWVYGYVDKYDRNVCYVNDILVNSKTIGCYTGIRDNTSWDELSEQQKEEFVEIVHQYGNIADINMFNAPLYWNGIPLFEGDIIDGKYLAEKQNYIVGKKWDMWGIYNKVDTKMSDFIAFDQLPFTKFKVIGNIYENPELMVGVI